MTDPKLRKIFWWVIGLVAGLLLLLGLNNKIFAGRTQQKIGLTHQTPTQALILPSSPILTLTANPVRTPTATPTSRPLETPTIPPLKMEVVKIPAPSLTGNLLGDPDKQYIQIYLPPSYASSDLRYPVVYFLPGFGGSTIGDSEYFLADELARMMVNGELKEMILVVPNGANRAGGSFYVNSPVTGNWEDYIIKDVLGYMDANYRTIKNAAGRGIGGHSMGGFGALNLAMKHPDQFSVVYSLSPGLLGEKGLADFHVFDTDKRIEHFLNIYDTLRDLEQGAALSEMGSYDGPVALALAYGTAFAPDPELGPPYFDYPYRLEDGKLVRDAAVWERWEDGMGNFPEKITKYKENLLKLGGIAIDYARQDRLNWIPRGSEYVANKLEKTGIDVDLSSFDGDHADKIEERLITIGLPFFSQRLADPK